MTASKPLITFILIFFATGCTNNKEGEVQTTQKDTLQVTNSEKKIFEILTDSIYKNKYFKITLEYYSDGFGNDNTDVNSIFTFVKQSRNKTEVLFIDTIFSRTGEIEFSDFNGDNVKDILIQNISDVRSNWTYYLYIVDTIKNRLRKIKGFEEIKNPNYLSQYDLIDNMVMSGRNWTSFYKIQGDSIIDYNIVIYDDHVENGNYEREYKKALKAVLAKGKSTANRFLFQ